MLVSIDCWSRETDRPRSSARISSSPLGPGDDKYASIGLWSFLIFLGSLGGVLRL